MNLYHYFSNLHPKSPMKSTYEIGDGEGTVRMSASRSAVKTARKIRSLGFVVPNEMNGPQDRQYTVQLQYPA